MESPTLLNPLRTIFHGKAEVEWKWGEVGKKNPLKCHTRFNLENLSESVACIRDPYWMSSARRELKYIKASLDLSPFDFITKEKLVELLSRSDFFGFNVSVTAKDTGYFCQLVRGEHMGFNNPEELQEILRSQNVPAWIKRLPVDMLDEFLCSNRGEKLTLSSLHELTEMVEFLPINQVRLFTAIFLRWLEECPSFEQKLNECMIIEKMAYQLEKVNQIDLKERHPLWISLSNQKKYKPEDHHRFISYFENRVMKICFKDVLQLSDIFLDKLKNVHLTLECQASIFLALQHVIEIILTFDEKSALKEGAKLRFTELIQSENWKEWEYISLKHKPRVTLNVPHDLLGKVYKKRALKAWTFRHTLNTEDLAFLLDAS